MYENLEIQQCKNKDKSSVRPIDQQVIRTYGRVEVHLHTFLTSALDGDQWSA